ncbi:proline--tRNA ligase [Candidatus Dojkabacteria bacterium]|nr:proline--tRNA ligase [Candidatus Dojkabacteria bacterium]
MKMSKLFTRTDKTSKDYDAVNATLLQKGGFIFQTMAGAYSFLPLGLRVLNKIEDIIRRNMDEVSQEILMPMTSPMHLWETTGRIGTVDIQAKVVPASDLARETNDGEYMLNFTHEEPNVPIVQKYTYSYKDLPVSTYQIQTKFRNEARPKSGLLRGREFRMKDMYSYHESTEDMKKYYEVMKDLYAKTFEDLGIGNDTVIAMASGGAFTDDYSHEFQTILESGEDTLFHVKSKEIYFNSEVAPSKAPDFEQDEEMKKRDDVLGKGIIGVRELADYLKIPIEVTTKTLLYKADEKYIAIAVRGDYEVNELKVKSALGLERLILASEEDVKHLTGAEVGYLGPLNLPEEVSVYYDDSTENRVNFECGANKTDYHTINVNWERDIEKPEKFYDFKEAKERDIYPETGEVYGMVTASEVGNIFPLHCKYSDAFNFRFIDENGDEKSVVMGCYGIGTTRAMGVIVEKFHDENGIVWPEQVAPFQVHLISLGEDREIISKAQEIYEQLNSDGVEVLWDDREDVRAGERFADADLIGNPLRVVVSKRSLEAGGIEIKKRAEKDSKVIEVSKLKELLSSY